LEEKKKGRIPQDKKKYISFAEIADPVIKICLKEGESIIIPSGWSYSIMTSIDAIVFSGRFLHIYSVEMQLRIHAEIDEQCPERGKLRFPYFEEMMWYLANDFSEKIQFRQEKKESGAEVPNFTLFQLQGLNVLSKWLKFYKSKKPNAIFSSQYVTDMLTCFLEGTPLPDINSYARDEEPNSDSFENNNNECFECNGKIESVLWVGCDTCSNWFHAECVGLTKKDVDDLTKSEREYICNRCTNIAVTDDGPNNDTFHLRKKFKTTHVTTT